MIHPKLCCWGGSKFMEKEYSWRLSHIKVPWRFITSAPSPPVVNCPLNLTNLTAQALRRLTASSARCQLYIFEKSWIPMILKRRSSAESSLLMYSAKLSIWRLMFPRFRTWETKMNRAEKFLQHNWSCRLFKVTVGLKSGIKRKIVIEIPIENKHFTRLNSVLGVRGLSFEKIMTHLEIKIPRESLDGCSFSQRSKVMCSCR